jgi:hypothetical protein
MEQGLLIRPLPEHQSRHAIHRGQNKVIRSEKSGDVLQEDVVGYVAVHVENPRAKNQEPNFVWITLFGSWFFGSWFFA